MSKFARWSIILSEDWSFYDHQGVDVEQIKVALNEMVEDKKFRGASTITQQMVKNVFLSDERTLWRKIHEVILAYKVEKNLSKNKILEIYLNVIEFGPGIYGIKEAARHYFKKHPSEITPREGAFLAMLLPSPKRYYVSFRKKELTRFAKARVRAILEKMRMGKIITQDEYLAQSVSKLSWEK
jgi:monofunctional biosynthetic peptidoglycan transglycosylase